MTKLGEACIYSITCTYIHMNAPLVLDIHQVCICRYLPVALSQLSAEYRTDALLGHTHTNAHKNTPLCFFLPSLFFPLPPSPNSYNKNTRHHGRAIFVNHHHTTNTRTHVHSRAHRASPAQYATRKASSTWWMESITGEKRGFRVSRKAAAMDGRQSIFVGMIRARGLSLTEV